MSRAETAKALGLRSVRDLDRMIERGAPAPIGRRGAKRYDVEAIRKWRADRVARAKPNLDLAQERAQLARAQTELTRLRFQRESGEVVRTADVEGVLRAVVTATKTQLLAVPRRCVLEGLPRKHERLVRRLVTEALRELSEAQTLQALARLGKTK